MWKCFSFILFQNALENGVLLNNGCSGLYIMQYSETDVSIQNVTFTFNSKKECDFLVLWRKIFGKNTINSGGIYFLLKPLALLNDTGPKNWSNASWNQWKAHNDVDFKTVWRNKYCECGTSWNWNGNLERKIKATGLLFVFNV